jgi:hypothetical protein
MPPLTNGAELRRALETQDEEAAELREILCGGMSQDKINSIIATRIIRICKAQVYQNHNTTVMASRMTHITVLCAINLIVLILVALGQPLNAQTIMGFISALFK